jgi:hypothetical protein
MGSEIFVASSVLKDLIYSIVSLIVFWILKWPIWWLYFFHAVTWASALSYFVSSDHDFWFSTLACTIGIGVVGLDVFILLNIVCYFNSVHCCVDGMSTSPFTLTFKVCGSNDRYQSDLVLYAAISTVALAISVGISRVTNMNATRKASSIEVALTALYVGLKIYMLRWSGVSFTAFFWLQSIFTMAADVVAIIISFKLRLVSTLIFAAVILVDLLVVLGATRAISFFEAAEQAVQHIRAPPTSGRRLLQSDDVTYAWPKVGVRAALSNAVQALRIPSESMPNAARSAMDSATGMMQSFVMSVAQACQQAHEQQTGFSCTDSLSKSTAALDLLQMIPCCDPNQNYMQTVSNSANVLNNLDLQFDVMWHDEGARFGGAVAQVQAEQVARAQAATASVPATPQAWTNLFKNVSRAIVNFWNKLVGKNVNQPQNPWVTATGVKVPSPIYVAWVVVHCICVGLVLYQLIGTLTRSHKLPGLFGAKKAVRHNAADTEDLANAEPSYETYTTQATRRKKHASQTLTP